jgi:hypothetical protein
VMAVTKCGFRCQPQDSRLQCALSNGPVGLLEPCG